MAAMWWIIVYVIVLINLPHLSGCGVPQNISNGYVKLTDNTDTANEATATVTCISGYEANTSTIKCLANGSWEYAICTEKAPCTADQWRCTNGDCIPLPQRCDNFTDCSDGTDEINCDSSPVCPEGLEWCRLPNGTEICVGKSFNCGCGPVNAIENGNINLQGNSTIGAVADVTCDSGYVASAPIATCLNTGQWENVVCTGVDCGSPPPIPDGSVLLTDATNTTYGATATVYCQTGYDAIPAVIKCQASKQWETAICTIKDCLTLTDSNTGSSYQVGSNATFTCTIQSYNNVQKWIVDSVVVAECGILLCGVNNSNPSEFSFNPNISARVFEFTINPLDSKYRDSIVGCVDGNNTVNLKINITDCGPIPTVENGNVVLNDGGNTTVGSKLSVICKTGYVAQKETITCLPSGHWETPNCSLPSPTTPHSASSESDKSSPDILLIVLLVIVAVFILVQMVISIFFQCKIYHGRKRSGVAEILKRVGSVILGSFPLFGIIFIVYSWRKDIYHDERSQSGNATNNSNHDKDVDYNHIQLKVDPSKSGDQQQSTESPYKAATNPTSDGTSSKSGDKQETPESPYKAATNPTYGETSSNSGKNDNSQIDSVVPESNTYDEVVLNDTQQTSNFIPTTFA